MLESRNLIVACALALFVACSALAFRLGVDSSLTTALILCIGSLLILGANWHSHDGGRSASFIFMILGVTFLAGRAFPVLFGDESQLALIGYGTPYEVSSDKVTHYVTLVLSSLLFVHIGSLLTKKVAFAPFDTQLEATIYKVMFFCFLPLLLYKNIYYFNYISNNGGYLAIYQGTEHLEGVGVLARMGALMCLATFTLYFFHETDKKKSRNALIFFIIVFSSELLVGLRGKFFVTALVFFLFYKLRFGGRFTVRGLAILMFVIIALAITIEVTREQKEQTMVTGGLLAGFLAQQGVSAGVSLIVLDNPVYFDQYSWSYFLRQFTVPFQVQAEVPQGWFLANDVSVMVMPAAFARGFGTGSSYLAELIILGGWAGVCLGSLIIGWVLTKAQRFTSGVPAALMFWVICGIVYYPRTMLHDPVHNMMRYFLPIILLAAACITVRQMVRIR